MGVKDQVEAALARVPTDWRTELARTLAASLDVEANASMARELRATMIAIEASRPAEIEGTPLDELARRRASRIPGADSGGGAGGIDEVGG